MRIEPQNADTRPLQPLTTRMGGGANDRCGSLYTVLAWVLLSISFMGVSRACSLASVRL
jgi:hypothetical protein